MKVFRKIITGLGISTALIVGGGVLLFSLPGTGWKALSVQTGSMAPNISTGSMVFVHRVPTSSLGVGDVITYNSLQQKNKTISHRITQHYTADGRVPGFVTKGDANKVADAPIVAGQVKGKVAFHVPYLGKIAKLLMTWPVIIALVYLPGLLVMIDELKRLTAYYKTLMPYKAAIVLAREEAEAEGKFKFVAVPIISLLLVAGSILFALPVQAMFKTNSVKLDNNNLVVTKPVVTPPPTNCSSNNNITVINTTTQSSSTGNANNSGNTNGGSATSGNATNNNSSNTNITIVGC